MTEAVIIVECTLYKNDAISPMTLLSIYLKDIENVLVKRRCADREINDFEMLTKTFHISVVEYGIGTSEDIKRWLLIRYGRHHTSINDIDRSDP
jgi:hypothetical protein